MLIVRGAGAFSRRVISIFPSFLLSLLLAGCGTATLNHMGGGTQTPPTVTIAANPASIAAGGSSTLTVAAANATQVTLSGSDGSSFTLQSNGGSVSVKPASTAVYTASANGPGGNAVATASVTVSSSSSSQPTVSIAANPTQINPGASSLLTVTATNATQVTITGSDGSSYTLSATGGTQAVSPSKTTTYTATATGASASATATATVQVTANPAPTVTISANPPSIQSGSSSTLTITAAYATEVTISGSDGTSYTLQSPNGGTQAVTPTQTTTYTATATGSGGSAKASTTVTVTNTPPPTVSISANPTQISEGNSSTLTVTASNATQVTVAGNDGSSYNLSASGGTQAVSPGKTTTYTATATGSSGGSATAQVTVTVNSATGLQSIDHVIFMLQENHTFDNYFGMLNPYRVANGYDKGADGNTYTVDGIDDKLNSLSNSDDEGTVYHPFKLASTCVDDMSDAWTESYGDVNRYDFTTSRAINMDGFVHNGEGFAKSCNSSGNCPDGKFTDTTGKRVMGYYDQSFLNYYYFMASEFALSDRWFSPVSTNTIDNRIATFTGGTTQGLTKDPGDQDHLSQLSINNIFEELDKAKVSWKIYYTVTDGYCLSDDDCQSGGNARYPASTFEELTYSYQYISGKNSSGGCTAPKQPSSVVGDSTNSFCIDPNHIAPIAQYYTDLKNGALPSFSFIEAGFGVNDEHPGSGNDILNGQVEVAKVINAFMASPEWKDSVFFFSYDEGGGPFDHVPAVPGHSNDFTDASLGSIPDISSIAVNPDSYAPCVPSGGTATTHCDLSSGDPGSHPGDAATVHGFAAQLGFRVPNMIISPFTRAHYVGHTPMDHTAVIKFVENRFVGGSAHLTARDAAQPDLLDFFDFTNVPWATPPSPPTPLSPQACTPTNMGP